MATSRLFWSLLVVGLVPVSIKGIICQDCYGNDCKGKTCEGDYCVLSQYAPRWGTVEWGSPTVVRGCVSGTLLRDDIRDHCEVAEDSNEVFTCFCNGADRCNENRKVRRIEKEDVKLLTCACSGSHCSGSTCLGEMCSFVKNHKTKKTEQGCVNATVPLIERRSLGACMMPPITGSMHHSVAKTAEDLLSTESCVCGTDYCNEQKPETTVKENERCKASATFTVMGNEMKSREIQCAGEYCFKAHIKSKEGLMSEYITTGCASFTGDDELVEELNPTGCAHFTSNKLEVKACFKTDDKDAIGRARALAQVPPQKSRSRSKGKSPKKPVEFDEMEEDPEEEEEEEEEVRKPSPSKEQPKEQPKKESPKQKAEEEEEEEEEETKVVASTPKSFIFENPTQAPIPDDSNTTMITVFILIMLCIVVSGAVWKLELHKKLFRANYDTVAGG